MKTLFQKVRWGRVWFVLSLVIIGALATHALDQRSRLQRYEDMGVLVPLAGGVYGDSIWFSPPETYAAQQGAGGSLWINRVGGPCDDTDGDFASPYTIPGDTLIRRVEPVAVSQNP